MTLLLYLADVSIRAIALAALAGAALWIFRVRSASRQHAVWTLVLFAMLATAALHPLLPPIPLRVLRAIPVPAPFSTSLPFTPIFRLAPDPPPPALDPVTLIATVLYFGGVTLLLARLIVGYIAMRRLILASTPDAARVRQSNQLNVPMTAGFLRPVILLPESSCEWSADTRLAVLAHEEAHIARGDWAIALVARINRAFFFFHPLAWWLERKLASLAEQACDDAALSQVRDRATYAEALLDMARAVTFAHGKIFTQGIAMARTANVKHRIESVLDESRRIPHALGRRGWATLLTCALPVLYIALAAQLAPAQAPPASATHATPTFKTPFQRWADEEVVYIITPEELAAYNRLAGSTAEQEHFIEQFWERRNPAPGTSENKYRDEHYRRIAYSNERLPGASAPGWQTDRGRIYITFGPPDEIESHPSSDARSVPYEQWLYRHIDAMGDNVIFTFTDYESNGDYRLAAATGPKGLQKSATVHVNPDHEAVMTLPLAEGKGPFSVVIEVSSGKGRTIVSKTEQGGVQLSSLVQRLGHLAPGHYTLKTRVTDIATGQTGVSVVNFTVP